MAAGVYFCSVEDAGVVVWQGKLVKQGVCSWSPALAGRLQNRAKPARIVNARRSLPASREAIPKRAVELNNFWNLHLNIYGIRALPLYVGHS